MWFLLLVEHLLSYLKLTKTSSIKVDIRHYSKHRIRKSTGNLTTFPHCFPAETILKTKEFKWKKKFSLEPLVGIFHIWRLLLWFYLVAPSPGADNIWIYFISHLLLLQASFTYSKSFFITITIKWCFCWSVFSWRRIHITLILSHHPCNRQHCTKNEVFH